ncbi:MAG: flagellar type III secretion system pore protein FliP [Clostridiales bacterium]|jgi:flagellar biosynthetic protein FliP|nr:flagellar type III secretion system pore protein FliP [Clostridiales bacterium]
MTLSIPDPGNPAQVASTLQLLFFMSLVGLAPSLLLMLTSFTRIIISLQFMRSAMGTQQMPPNQVLVGIALFLTLFLMGPIFTEIQENALKPYASGELSQQDAIDQGMAPLRHFMRNQVEEKDVALFIKLSGVAFTTREDIPDRVLIPAFMLGELTKGFKIGFVIYLPFIVIDMVVASVLMAMGMMMLPPAMISLPFKILLFIMSGGWSFLIESVARTFRLS